MGRRCLAGQQHDRDVPSRCSLATRSILEIFARTQFRTMTSALRAASGAPGRQILLGQLVGQESAISRAVLDEKDANGVRLADGGEKRVLFKSGGDLKSLPSLACSKRKPGGQHTKAPASRQSSAVTRDYADRARDVQLPSWRSHPPAEHVTCRNVVYPRHPYCPMLADRHPCRSRIPSD